MFCNIQNHNPLTRIRVQWAENYWPKNHEKQIKNNPTCFYKGSIPKPFWLGEAYQPS